MKHTIVRVIQEAQRLHMNMHTLNLSVEEQIGYMKALVDIQELIISKKDI